MQIDHLRVMDYLPQHYVKISTITQKTWIHHFYIMLVPRNAFGTMLVFSDSNFSTISRVGIFTEYPDQLCSIDSQGNPLNGKGVGNTELKLEGDLSCFFRVLDQYMHIGQDKYTNDWYFWFRSTLAEMDFYDAIFG